MSSVARKTGNGIPGVRVIYGSASNSIVMVRVPLRKDVGHLRLYTTKQLETKTMRSIENDISKQAWVNVIYEID